MATVEIKVPDIGDIKDVAVIEVLVKVGDTVKPEQSLISLESDKASMEIPSPQGGVVRDIKVKVGDKVNKDSPILSLETDLAGQEQKAPANADSQENKKPGKDADKREAAQAPASAGENPSAAPAAKGGEVELVVPDIGDFKDVAVIEVLIKVGDTIKPEQSLVTVESDKASMEIPASTGGVVRQIKVAVGDKINRGSALATVESQGAQAAQAPAKSEPAKNAATDAATPSPSSGADKAPSATSSTDAPVSATDARAHASPSIRKRARELGVPLAEVQGTGPKGRITQVDLDAFVKSVMRGEAHTAAQKGKGSSAVGNQLGVLPWPTIDFAKFGPIERQELSRIKKIAGANLHRNWVMIPHVTNCEDADITELEAFRVELNKENEKTGIKLTLLAFLIKACVAALKKFPDFNASLDGEFLVRKNYFHIGFAVDTPNGLVVPVLRDADGKGVLQIAKEMGELAAKARDGKLSTADISGGSFSISSLGGIGGTYFTPIINAPEVAILGVCKSATRPVWNGKSFDPRLILPLSLSWDHRVIDGATAARFNTYLAQILADFRRVLL